MSCKHDAGKHTSLILQRKIDVAAGVIFAVGDFSLDIDLLQDKVLRKHIFNVSVDLSD